jgi:hypothetical protein
MLADGASAPSIVAHVAEEFDVTPRQARTDVAAMRERWATEIAEQEPHRRGQLLSYLDAVAREAFEDRNWSAAVGAARELARILGLGVDVTAVHVSAGEPSAAHMRVLSMTPAQRAQRRRELEAKRDGLNTRGGT